MECVWHSCERLRCTCTRARARKPAKCVHTSFPTRLLNIGANRVHTECACVEEQLTVHARTHKHTHPQSDRQGSGRNAVCLNGARLYIKKKKKKKVTCSIILSFSFSHTANSLAQDVRMGEGVDCLSLSLFLFSVLPLVHTLALSHCLFRELADHTDECSIFILQPLIIHF